MEAGFWGPTAVLGWADTRGATAERDGTEGGFKGTGRNPRCAGG